jgi:hypothetical protein
MEPYVSNEESKSGFKFVYLVSLGLNNMQFSNLPDRRMNKKQGVAYDRTWNHITTTPRQSFYLADAL